MDQARCKLVSRSRLRGLVHVTCALPQLDSTCALEPNLICFLSWHFRGRGNRGGGWRRWGVGGFHRSVFLVGATGGSFQVAGASAERAEVGAMEPGRPVFVSFFLFFPPSWFYLTRGERSDQGS